MQAVANLFVGCLCLKAVWVINSKTRLFALSQITQAQITQAWLRLRAGWKPIVAIGVYNNFAPFTM